MSAVRDARGAEHGEAVTGNHQLGAEGSHLAQGDRPLARIALHLLRVAGVGRGPDEEIAGGEDLALGDPRPDGVLGLAAGVVKLEGQIARGEGQPIVELDVRVAVLIGPAEAIGRQPKLAQVDGGVPAERLQVAIEVAANERVRVDARPRPGAGGCFLLEGGHPEDVVHVVMGEDGRHEGSRRPPAANGFVQRTGVGPAAGVEHHQAGSGVECVGAGDALVEEHPGRDLLAVALESSHRMVRARVDLALPELLG